MRGKRCLSMLKRITVVVLCAFISFAYLPITGLNGTRAYADDYNIDVYYSSLGVINEEWTQADINDSLIREYDSKDISEIIVRNQGSENLTFSAESIEIDEELSDTDAFIIEPIKGIHTIEPEDSLTLARVVPKAGQDVGTYYIEFSISDETGNINTTCTQDFTVVGSEPKILVSPAKVETELEPWQDAAEEQYISIRNVYKGTFDQLSVQSDNSKFEASFDTEDNVSLSCGDEIQLIVNYNGDIGELPKDGDRGMLTITAKDTENNKKTSIEIPLHIAKRSEEENPPSFLTEKEDLKRKVMEEFLAETPEEFWVYYNAENYEKVAFALAGNDAEHFTIKRQENIILSLVNLVCMKYMLCIMIN